MNKFTTEIKTENWLGHEIRFVEHNGEWWAVAADITKALNIKNTSEAVNGNHKKNAKGLADSQKGICKLYTLGGEQEILIVNEPGIYRLIFRSNKPEAEVFQDWVYNMLKELRTASGLEGFQIFRMLDKDYQREAMDKLKTSLKQPVKVDYIKANIIADKAVSNIYGYSKMVKKNDMTPDMLVMRQGVLQDVVELMTINDKFGLRISVSDLIYGTYRQ